MSKVREMKNIYRNESGITGLETAIILIAFVVVAAVFAYTVLSAGLFSSQKSQEAVYDALDETRSTIQPSGSMILYDADNNESVDRIDITFKLAMNGEPMDFTPNSGTTAGQNLMIICYQDASQWKKDMEWSLTKLGYSDSDNLMENDESFLITIANLESGTTNGLNPDLQRNTTFAIEVKPPQGAAILMERTTPREIDMVMNLH
ncbi:MAG: hypothetical protein FJZ95_00675 [Chloroflexi bacterium]|nr:hypothetical protein [Chloroflexota bacterium]